MSRTLSAAAIKDMFAQSSGEAFLLLLTLEHPDMTTVRVVNNTESVTSRGNVYIGFPFECALPNDVADQLASVQLRISNVDRRIVGELRGIEGPMSATAEVIAASRPDVVEIGPMVFDLTNAEYDVESIVATLAYEPILSEPFPAGVFDPQRFPAVFGST